VFGLDFSQQIKYVQFKINLRTRSIIMSKYWDGYKDGKKRAEEESGDPLAELSNTMSDVVSGVVGAIFNPFSSNDEYDKGFSDGQSGKDPNSSDK